MSYRAVLFDLGYTLLDYPVGTPWREFLRARLAEMCSSVCSLAGVAQLRPEEFADTLAAVIRGERARTAELDGHSWRLADRVREALAMADIPSSAAVVEKLTGELLDPVRSRVCLYQETVETLRRLREAGLDLGIISNSPWDAPGSLTRDDMMRCGIAEYFDVVIISGDVPWRKPNPEFMWAAAKALGAKAEACLVVGDSLEADIAGARAAGMRSMWVNRGGASKAEDDAQPDFVGGDLRRVPEVVLDMSGA